MNATSKGLGKRSSDEQNSVHAAFVFLTACLLLSGCAGVDLTRDSSQISGGYDEATNQQMLLNMARLQNDDPPYFVQLSNITTQNVLSGTAQFSPSNVNELHNTAQTTVAALSTQGPSTWTLGGMVGGSVSQTPTFTFVPLNGDPLSAVTSIPLTPQLFYEFIRQGICIDMVARLMLNSFDVPIKIPAGTATFKGFDGQGKMVFSYFQLYSDKYERLDLQKLLDDLNDEANRNLITITDKAKAALTQDTALIKQHPSDSDVDEMSQAIEKYYDNHDIMVVDVKKDKGRIITDIDKVAADKMIEAIAKNAYEVIPIQDPAGYYLDADRHRILDKNGYRCDKWGNFCHEDGSFLKPGESPISEVKGNIPVAVYYPTTYTLQNNPLATTYPDFLVWCYNQYILQKNFLLSVSDSSPQSDTKPDPIYTIKDLKLADLVAAQGAGYEVVPYTPPSVAAVTSPPDASDANAPEPYNRYIIKKTGGTASSPKASSLKVDKQKYENTSSAVNNDLADFSPGLSRLLRLTNQVADFDKPEDIFGGPPQSVSQANAARIEFLSLPTSTEAPSPPGNDLSTNSQSTSNPNSVTLNLRTFVSVLRGVTKEQLIFDKKAQLAQSTHTLFPFVIKGQQVKSLMTLDAPNPVPDDYYVLSYQNYRGKRYYIGDDIDKAMPHDFFKQENKRAFTLLTILYADVALDPTKLQQPVQIIQ
jgi:hypothetical protein